MYQENVYLDIIKNLMQGWQANYKQGIIQQEWWHPQKPVNYTAPMTDAEFEILSRADDEINAQVRLDMDID